jgi:phosphatidate phosphatase PAH1
MVSPLNPQQLFFETNSDNETKETCFKFYMDEAHVLDMYPKDRPFTQFRRDITFQRLEDYHYTPRVKQQIHEKSKSENKPVNKKLHQMFLGGKQYRLCDLLVRLELANFNTIPKCFRIQVKNARVLKFHGNARSLLAENDTHFFLYHWCGS